MGNMDFFLTKEMGMRSGWRTILVSASILLAAVSGCSAPEQARQPVDELNPNDSGLQSKDVVGAADKMSRDLLADPALNASGTAWTLVVSNMEDKTTDQVARINFDIFLQALKGDLAQKSTGRIQLIENKQQFHELRNKELEGNAADATGQGGPQAINPDYALYGTAMDLPNRATNFYQIEFKVINLHNRTIAFDRLYQVKVAR
jgi:hypothetical protein